MTPTFFLVCALVCLIVALVACFARRFNAACTRNTVTVDIDCDVDHAREGIRQLTADVERLHSHVRAARRDLAELKADRTIIGLPVYRVTNTTTKPAGQVPPRRSPPAPIPQGKKKPQGKR